MFKKFVTASIVVAVLAFLVIQQFKKTDAKMEVNHTEHNIKFEQNKAIALEIMDQVDDSQTNWSAVQNTTEVARIKAKLAANTAMHKKAAKAVDDSLNELAAELDEKK